MKPSNNLYCLVFCILLTLLPFSSYSSDEALLFTDINVMALIHELVKQKKLDPTIKTRFKKASGRHQKFAEYIRKNKLVDIAFAFIRQNDTESGKKICAEINSWIDTISPQNTPPKQDLVPPSPKTSPEEELQEKLLEQGHNASQLSDALEVYIAQSKFVRRKSPKIDENQTSLLTEALKSPLSLVYDPSLMIDGDSFGQVLERLETIPANQQKPKKPKNLANITTSPTMHPHSKKKSPGMPKKHKSEKHHPTSPVGFLQLLFTPSHRAFYDE